MNRTRRRTCSLLGALALLLLACASASADVIFVGSPTCPAPPGCAVFGGEVNGISGQTFTLSQSSGPGSDPLTDPVLLIVGVSDGGNTPGSISLSHGTVAAGPTPAGTMTSAGPITDAYQALGFSNPESGAGNSESFTNWAAADSAVLKMTVSSFNVYYYELDNTGLIGHPSTVDVTFKDAGLSAGSFVVAYGCDSSGTSWTNPCDGSVYATPFTQSALEVPQGTQPVPEPNALAMFGMMGLLGFGLARNRAINSN